MDRLKYLAGKVYKWLTVIVGMTVGAASLAIEMLDVVSGIDLSAFLPPETALKITTGVAAFKAVCVWVQKIYTWMTAEDAK